VKPSSGRWPVPRLFPAALNFLGTHARRQTGPRRGTLFGVRLRLTLWYVGILALVLVLFSVAIYATEQQALLSQVDSRVNVRLRQLAGSYDAGSERLTAPPDTATAQGMRLPSF
jgi:hypothetical protein